MSLLKQWQDIAYVERTEEEYNEFWSDYLPKEQKNYEWLLAHTDETLTGTVTELAAQFEMNIVTFVGFLDGMNTSLVTALDLETIEENTSITLNLDLEKLFYNMHVAQADWLYNLPGWDALLTVERRKEIKKEYNKTKTVVNEAKIGRNDPCPCGSGRKYKQCCLNK